MPTSGFFLFQDSGESLLLHLSKPGPGYVTLSYEPGDETISGDAIVLPEPLFEQFVRAYFKTT